MADVDRRPSGSHLIRAEMLTREHPSILRNPLIAGAFHRTGAVEVWGSGTNRVIDACRKRGVAQPAKDRRCLRGRRGTS